MTDPQHQADLSPPIQDSIRCTGVGLTRRSLLCVIGETVTLQSYFRFFFGRPGRDKALSIQDDSRGQRHCGSSVVLYGWYERTHMRSVIFIEAAGEYATTGFEVGGLVVTMLTLSFFVPLFVEIAVRYFF